MHSCSPFRSLKAGETLEEVSDCYLYLRDNGTCKPRSVLACVLSSWLPFPALFFPRLLSAKPCSGFTFKALSRFRLDSKGLPGSHRQDCRISPRSPCSACPLSNNTHHLEKLAHTTHRSCQPQSLWLAHFPSGLYIPTTNEPITEVRQLRSRHCQKTLTQ
ncbi:hypothetical protein ATANTOWER_025493 [Ataeniobius toweri]|uniref:Uncharacterized protein n=1 Tax=Ataeniobius toweri TaxID=208326 RepID=A0ABU7B019_9TELE|nr:hypothetical protein [Ataeniobius toweri]